MAAPGVAATVAAVSTPDVPLAIAPTADGWALVGDVDAHTSPALAEALAGIGTGENVIDVAEVDFMDSSGLRVLVDASTRARAAGGTLVLLAPNASLRRLIEITGLEGLVTLRAPD